MLLAVTALRGYAIEATDGRLGTASDFLFDDESWTVRWLVIDTGGWLTGRKVLIHPSAIAHADHDSGRLVVALTRAQVEGSPAIFDHQPVSQRLEASLYDYYRWDPYWGSNYFPIGAMALPLSSPPFFGAVADRGSLRLEASPGGEDSRLRSIAEVKGYHIHATDGAIGHLENFLIDDAQWDIRYLIVDTKNWWPGQHVLLSPFAVREIIWSDRRIMLNVARDNVKTSPPWDPIAMIDQVYEKALHRHYGWPGYGF